jgi:hypothetical protein
MIDRIQRTISRKVNELMRAKPGGVPKSAVLAKMLARRNRDDGYNDLEVARAVNDWFERARFGFGGRYRGP